MLTGAMILGILGGVFGLGIGLFGYTLGGLASAGGAGGAGLLQIVSIAIPIAGIVGGGMVKAKAVIGAVLMALSAIGMFFVFGFNFFTAIPLVVTAIGSGLGFAAANEAKAITKP